MRVLRVAVAAALVAGTAAAQREARIVSPEVHADRTITFRLKGPEVTTAAVSAGWIGKEPKAMVTGADGVWSVTLGPVAPDILDYSYRIDGVQTIDPHNARVKLWQGGAASLVEVPGEAPLYYDLQDVPHGDVHAHYYQSKTVGETRRVYVYTPPGYEAGTKSYPALYLLHGSGDNESTWTEVGRAHLILDNLIAAGKAEPMVVVMPNGHPVPWGTRAPGNSDLFRQDLVEDLMPVIERRYRVKKDRGSRAVAGLSMGGGQAVDAGLGRTDLFRYVGAFSAYVDSPGDNATVKQFAADVEKANEPAPVLWVSIGEDDFLLDNQKAFHGFLEERGIRHTFQITAGYHSWLVWRPYLRDFAPLLFRAK
jgi:enterochelin esterase family protein